MTQAGDTPIIQLTNVDCVFGKLRAVDSLSLTVSRGQVLGILGPNGAGKTTLIDIICGLVRPSAGTVCVMGMNVVESASAVRAQIGVLPQETALYGEVSARQNLKFAAALYNVPKSSARIEEVLELVGLRERANDTVRSFSGGMQRRLAIARALLHNPPLLILDEPTLGVDIDARHEIWAHIRSLRLSGHTVVLTTNYLDEAEALCDRIAILRAGKLVVEDSPSSLASRAGRCLEIECDAYSASQIASSLKGSPDILRTELCDFGLRVYLAVHVNPEKVVHNMLGVSAFEGFRVRAPDLAEIFRSLATGVQPA
jgi:ABC-2 type transport system ATP-binding protein